MAPRLARLHGYQRTDAIWHRVLRALDERFRFVLPNLHHNGKSSKPAGALKALNRRAIRAFLQATA